MVAVAAADAIAGAAQQAIKRTSRVVVVVEYPIIELCIRMAISAKTLFNKPHSKNNQIFLNNRELF